MRGRHRATRAGGAAASAGDGADPMACPLCGMQGADVDVVICDMCLSEYHLRCLEPPLAAPPVGSYWCVECLVDRMRQYSGQVEEAVALGADG